jgi:hypothetical protein
MAIETSSTGMSQAKAGLFAFALWLLKLELSAIRT